MTRLFRVIVHNWPLKLAAIGLATVLYAGLVVSQSTLTFPGPVPVKPVNQPPDTFLLAPIPPVTSIRYFAPPDVPVAAISFTATVDLAGVDPQAGTASVPVTVDTADSRIRIISFEPSSVTVQLDPLKSRDVNVEVERGTVPDGLEVGETTVEPKTVTVLGPKSIVDRVSKARADVVIQPGGIDVDQDVVLEPVDDLGNVLSPVDVDPPTARVRIPVFSDRQSRTVPVAPVIVGTPAAGFEVETVTVEPTAVTVEGDADQLADLVRADTEPVSVTGASSELDVPVGLDLPTGVVPLGDTVVRVHITLRPVTGTRTFEAGTRLVGARSDLAYAVAVDSILVTIGGPVADLDRLEGAQLAVELDVTGLGPGTTDVPATMDLAAGLTLVSVSPPTVSVTISAPASPSPSADGTAPGSPSPSPSPAA